LRRELNLNEPGLVPSLHRRASVWHLQAGYVAEAVGHAIAAGDLAHAAELIAAHWLGFVHDGKFGIVDGWLQALGDPILLADARLCLVRAWTSFAMARRVDVLPWTEAAQAAPRPAPIRDGTTSVAAGAANLRASYWLVVGNLDRARHFAMAAIELEKDLGWLAVATNCAGMACYWLGDTAAAEAHLEQAVRHPQLMPLVVVHALGHLAMIHAEQGEWDRAEDRATAALDLAHRHGTSEYWMNAMAHITRARVLQHCGQLTDAEKAVVRGLKLAKRGSIPIDLAYGLMTLAQVRHRLGDREGARELLRRARDTLAGSPDPGLLPALIESVSQRLLGVPAEQHHDC
jgi:LuxR family transcriptional regulator, maltose regulon positive regulatory protein